MTKRRAKTRLSGYKTATVSVQYQETRFGCARVFLCLATISLSCCVVSFGSFEVIIVEITATPSPPASITSCAFVRLIPPEAKIGIEIFLLAWLTIRIGTISHSFTEDEGYIEQKEM